MKTLKQIADEIGVSKQRVYRFIKKNHINDVHHEAGIIYISDTLEELIKSHFQKNNTHHDTYYNCINDTMNDAVLNTLINQIKEKDNQIQELNNRLAEVNGMLENEQKMNGHNLQRLHELTNTNQSLIEMSTFQFAKFKRKMKRDQDK